MILDMVVGGVIGWFKDKSAIKKAKVEGEIKAIHNASQNTADWEQLHAKGSQSSWKDEFWTIIFSIPLVLGFTGEWGVAITTSGFEALTDMPEWYQYTLVTMVLASFGIKMSGSVKKMLGK